MASLSAYASLLAPGTRKQMMDRNDYVSQMLLDQGLDQSPIQSPIQGFARLAQAYVGKKMIEDSTAKRQGANQHIADLLAPPKYDVANGERQSTALPNGTTLDYQNPVISQTADPRNAQIADLLNAGIGTDTITTRALDQLGLGKPKDPIKLGENERLIDSKDFHEIVKPAPGKPQVAGGMVNDPVKGWIPIPGYEDQQSKIRAAGRPQMSVNVSADKSFGTQLGENAGKILDASHSAALGGIQTIQTAHQILGALDSGKVTAGPGASAIQFFNQVSGGNPEAVAQTRSTIQGLAKLSLAARNQLKGQGQISDYEGRLLAKASSGEIDNMTVPEIRIVTQVAERAARLDIKRNSENVDKARRSAPNNQDLVDFYTVNEPPAYAPAPKKSGRFTIEQVQ